MVSNVTDKYLKMKKLLFTVAFFATISLTAQTMAFTAVEIKAKDYTQKDIAEAFDKVFEGVKMNQAGVTLERRWMGSTKGMTHRIVWMSTLGVDMVDEGAINPDKNEIIVGSKENLGKKIVSLKDLNLLTDKKDFNKNIFVKVRSTGNLLEAKVDLRDDNTAHVNLTNPEDGISPGQACVFYNKDQFGHKVLGGGWIKE